jgi:hypothetical protein
VYINLDTSLLDSSLRHAHWVPDASDMLKTSKRLVQYRVSIQQMAFADGIGLVIGDSGETANSNGSEMANVNENVQPNELSLGDISEPVVSDRNEMANGDVSEPVVGESNETANVNEDVQPN